MKRQTSPTRIARVGSLLGLIFFVGIVAVRAQIQPFVDCVERERDQSGAATGNYIA